MTTKKNLKVVVRAGQTYLAKARRGTKRVVIEQVRANGGDPYALAHEIDPEGKRRPGRDGHGLLRGMQFTVKLTWDGGRAAWIMPPFYAEEDQP